MVRDTHSLTARPPVLVVPQGDPQTVYAMVLGHDAGRDQPVQLPRSAAVRLKTWYTLASGSVPRRIQTLPNYARVYDLFTDATPGGWGAVCTDRPTKRTVIAGSRWGVEAYNINGAETWAVSCVFAAFLDFLAARCEGSLAHRPHVSIVCCDEGCCA
jgi:hypothetical protein